jgi:hypothetical protein
MPINPIAMQVKPASTSGMLNTLAAIRQMQTAGQQQQMNQLAIEKAQREKAESEAFKNALSQFDYSTPEGMANIIKQSPTLGLGLQKNAAALRASQTSAQLNEEKLAKSRNEYFQTQATRIQKPEDAVRYFNALYKDQILGPRMQQIDSLENAINSIPTDPQKFQGFVRQLAGGPMALENMYKEQSAKDLAAQGQRAAMDRTLLTQQQTTAMNVLKNNARYDEVAGAWVANPGVSQATVDQAQRVVNQGLMGMFGGGASGQQPDLGEPIEGTQPSAPPLPPPVPAEGIPGTRTLEMRPTDQAVPTKLPTVPGQEATPTLLTSPEDIQAARAAGKAKIRQEEKNVDLALEEPDMRNASASNMSLAFNTIGQINTLLNDPALKSVTGNWAGAVPTLTGLMSQGNANANALIQSLRSKAWLNSVKAFGKSSGLSPITDVEGAKLEAAYAMLDQTQGTPQFKKALEDFQKQLESSNRSIVNAFNRKYGNLGIKGWQPMSVIGGFPDEAIQTLKSDPTPQNIKEFNQHFGEDTAKYFLQGVK